MIYLKDVDNFNVLYSMCSLVIFVFLLVLFNILNRRFGKDV